MARSHYIHFMSDANPYLTYPERRRQMTAEQRAAIKTVLTEQRDVVRACAAQYCGAAVAGVNAVREIGRQIELFTGHEKLLPMEFQAIALPDATLEFARLCLSVHHKHPEAVNDYATAAAVWQEVLKQLELLPKGERGESSSPPLTEPAKLWLAAVVKGAQETSAFMKTVSMENLDRFWLEAFVRESQPLADCRTAALRRLGQDSE